MVRCAGRKRLFARHLSHFCLTPGLQLMYSSSVWVKLKALFRHHKRCVGAGGSCVGFGAQRVRGTIVSLIRQNETESDAGVYRPGYLRLPGKAARRFSFYRFSFYRFSFYQGDKA